MSLSSKQYDNGWFAPQFELVAGVPCMLGLLFECGRSLSMLVRISIVEGVYLIHKDNKILVLLTLQKRVLD